MTKIWNKIPKGVKIMLAVLIIAAFIPTAIMVGEPVVAAAV